MHFIVLLLFLLQKLIPYGKFSISHSSANNCCWQYVACSAKNENGCTKSGWNIDILIFRNTLESHQKFGEETLETPVIYINNIHDLNQKLKQCNNYNLGNQVTLFLEVISSIQHFCFCSFLKNYQKNMKFSVHWKGKNFSSYLPIYTNKDTFTLYFSITSVKLTLFLSHLKPFRI